MGYVLHFSMILYCVTHVCAFDFANSSNGATLPSIPKTCLNMTYCQEKPHDYPNLDFLNKYKLNLMVPQPMESDEDDFRIGTGDYDPIEGNCEAEIDSKKLVWMLQDMNGEWFYVVQTDKFEQRVTTMKCKPMKEKGCYRVYAEFPRGYETFCQQKYSEVLLLVVKERVVKLLPLEYESCCVCKYRKSKRF